MTNISFYVLKDTSLDARLQFAIKFVRQFWRKGFDIHCHVNSSDHASDLDHLMWADRESFIPHEIQISDKPITKSTVGIGWRNPPDRSGILVNLDNKLPDWFPHFDHLVEIVVQEPTILNSTRETWRNLAFKGYPIKKYDLNT